MSDPAYLAPHVCSFFVDYLRCRRNVSSNTVQSYRDAPKLLLRFAAGRAKRAAVNLLVTDITEEVVVAFLTDLEQTRGNSIQTRNHRLVGIRRLFAYIGEREPPLLGHCHKVVTVPAKRGAPVPAIHHLEKDQITALLDAVPRGDARGRRDYTLLLFMYNTGARVQEVADTRLSWFTLSPSAKVDLLGEGRKWRTCPLWESTARHVQQLIEERGLKPEQDGHLFVNRSGQPLSRSGIAEIIGRHARQAGVTTPGLRGRKVTPHTIRHTTAMHLFQSGVEVNVIRSWLGHVSIATTNRYIEIDLEMKRKALEACEVGRGEPPVAGWRSSSDILTWLESL
jgi:integrase/recombinase XerD